MQNVWVSIHRIDCEFRLDARAASQCAGPEGPSEVCRARYERPPRKRGCSGSKMPLPLPGSGELSMNPIKWRPQGTLCTFRLVF